MLADRFYRPPAARSPQKLWRSGDGAGFDGSMAKSKSVPCIGTPESRLALDDEGDSDVCCPSAGIGSGNLDHFLQATTPTVSAQYFSKTVMRGWRNRDAEFRFFFSLGDLWESFKEWSAYGAGVPLMLNGCDSVIQYYVPYLSAIQLYADSLSSSSSKLSHRRPFEEHAHDSYWDTSSDGSFEMKIDKILVSNKKAWSWHEASTPIIDGQFSIEKSINQEGSSSDDDMHINPRDCLLFEFFEQSSPYNRQPLVDKIIDLAFQFPKLKTLKSCDLSPASWISVAWYPIYRIPTGPMLCDLDACFLTFHALSTPLEGSESGLAETAGIDVSSAAVLEPIFSLPAFGLASYKFKSSVWTTPGGYERQQANSLFQAADNWLRLLRVNHPDFSFFASRATYWSREYDGV